MISLWNVFSLDQDQYSLLQTVATAFGLWYPEQGGYVIPTLMKSSPPDMAVEKVLALQGVQENNVSFHNLPTNEYQIVMKFVFPDNIPKGKIKNTNI